MNVKDKDMESQSKNVSNSRSGGVSIYNFLKSTAFGILYGAVGYFLGGLTLPFGATPFGIALLAASDRRVFYVYAGLFIAALAKEDRIVLISIYTSVLLLRLLTRMLIDPIKDEEGVKRKDLTVREVYPLLFSEHISLRMSISAVGAFALGLYRLISGGMLYYDLYGTIISVCVAPLSVLSVGGFFSKTTKKHLRLLGFIAISFGFIFSLGETKLYGISLAAACCTFITLMLTKREGTVLGILSGSLLGLAISLEYVPIFAFAALSAGILFPISSALAVTGALAVSVAWGIYVQGIGILNGLASALVCSSLLYTVCDKLFFSMKKADAASAEVAGSTEKIITRESEISRARLKDAQKRMSALEESYRTMSEILTKISSKLKTPGAADIKQICDNAFDSVCTSCDNKNHCWGEKYRDSSRSLTEIASVIREKGSVSVNDVDGTLVCECTRLPDILSEINHNTSAHRHSLAENDKTELFALDYACTAEFINAANKTYEDEYAPDNLLGKALLSELSERDIKISEVVVFGGRKKRIAVSCNDTKTLIDEIDRIRNTVSEICPFGIDSEEVDPDTPTVRFTQKNAICVSTSKRNLSAVGEEQYCGDTCGSFTSENGKFYSFISDGMGSGREAALTSGIVGVFLHKFLLGGECSCQSVISLINGFLRNKNGSIHECSATVDLLELDLICKRASFFKCGAAPTYVFRNGNLFKLRSHTVPIGIIAEPDLRRIDIDVSVGDLIVMVSDGVTDGKEECPWLFDLLRTHGEETSTARLADLIVKYAKDEKSPDDISAIVIRISDEAKSRVA